MRQQADDLIQYISTDDGATWDAIICLTQNGVSSSDSSTETQTKCGTIVAAGSGTNQFTGTGVIETAPSAGELSYMDLWALKNAGTQFLIVEKNTDESVFTMGTGQVTDISSDASSGSTGNFSYTIKISGAISLAAAS